MIYRLVMIGLAISAVLNIQKILYMVEAFLSVPDNLSMAVPAIVITIGGYLGVLCLKRYNIESNTGKDTKSNLERDVVLSLTATALMLNPVGWFAASIMRYDLTGCIISGALLLVNSPIAYRLVKRIGSQGPL
ncbi:MAG: hypothetical protein IMF26_01260 [Candidatus Fermentithermobacillus carboniphilus]|uniref:Uncharacterized protein n=1 Tax=Candidatus Fermentithermobacillus carboniphilus TaxID=3085328 RepID=A0AAT9LDE8_9FIRM|nr:MAG: hypothetical protein IMF26_01260 [Candidatus Fermentithermobacillus carboniphilus]